MAEVAGMIKFDFDSLPLFGRVDEISVLRDALEQTRSPPKETDGGPQVVLIGGVSGTGKSALVDSSLRASVRQDSGFFVVGKYDQLKDHSQPFSGLLECLRDLVLAMMERLTTKELAMIRQALLNTRDHANEIAALAIFVPQITEIVDTSNYATAGTDAEFNQEHGFDRLDKSVRNLLRAVCGSLGRPIVMFVDNLTWADPGSLSLLQTIAFDKQIHNLLIIGAYRNNEVDEHHLLSKTIDRMVVRSNVKVMTLSNISRESINEMLVEMSQLQPAETFSLAVSVYKKTHGNPFFLIQYLQLLFKNRYICISQVNFKWEWDETEIISDTDVSDNVVDLVASKIEGLPPKTIQALKIAACLGCRFRTDIIELTMAKLDLLSENDLDEGDVVEKALSIASEETLIEQLSGQDENFLEYKFSHDRIQQSVYEKLTTDDERVKIHYNIGSFLASKQAVSFGRRDSQRQMLMTDQLNRGGGMLVKKEDRFRLALSNREAAEGAKNQSAFFAAVDYLKMGISLLEEETRWTDNYACMIEMSTELAQLQNATGDFDGCQSTIDDILRHAKSFDDKLQACIQRIDSYGVKGRTDDAIKVAVGVLRELGEPISAKPNLLALGREFVRAKRALRGMTDDDLMSYPLVTDAKAISVFKILVAVGAFAFHDGRKKLYAVAGFRGVSLMLKYGLYSAYEFSAYGVLMSALGDLGEAYRFGVLSNKAATRFGKEAYSRATILNGMFLTQLREPFHDMIDPVLDAYYVGMQVGSPKDATTASSCYLYAYFQCSLPLEPLVRDLEEFGSEMKRYSQTVLYHHTRVLHQVVLNLLGRSDDPLVLQGVAMNEVEYSRIAEKAVLTHMWMFKILLAVTFCNWKEAGNAARYCWKLKQDDDANLMSSFTRRFLMGIASTRMAMATKNRIHLRRGRSIIRFMEKSVRQSNVNCHHMLMLLKAEEMNLNRAKIKDHGQIQKAYDRAISSARRSGFSHHAAMAYEMAGVFFLDKEDLDQASFYIGKARELYVEWGAVSKVRYLDCTHRHLNIEPNDDSLVGTSYRGVSRYCSSAADQHKYRPCTARRSSMSSRGSGNCVGRRQSQTGSIGRRQSQTCSISSF